MRLGPFALLGTLVMITAGCVGGGTASTSTSPSTTVPTATVTDATGSIDGTIAADDQSPIAGAQVGIAQPPMNATADAAGHFVFNALEAGKYRVIAQRLGYEAAAKEITVTAGEIAKVQFVLKSVAITSDPVIFMKPYDGFMQCSVSAFSPVNPCGGVTGEDKTSWILDIDRTRPLKQVVIELVWTQTSAVTGDEMEIEFCDDITDRNVLCAADQTGGYYTFNDGKSPVVLRVTDVPKDLKQILLGAGAKFESKPVVQQKFTEYISWCYVQECPEDYSAVPK